MADEDGNDEEEAEAPAVELGDGGTVDGAPLGRIASRLTWPQEKSEVVRKEGDSVVRTPDGGRALADLLEDVDDTYFARRQDFVGAIQEVVGQGVVPTE